MTAKDRQCLLAVLQKKDGGRYYTSAIDGLWGSRSKQALRDFQRSYSLEVTGAANPQTDAALRRAIAGKLPEQEEPETFWQQIQHFSPAEFRCKCGGKYCDGFPHPVQPLLVQLCDRARNWSGHPIQVVSGLRCEIHNRNCKGVANSQHMYGEAVDVYFYGVTPEKALTWLKSQPEVRYAYRISGSNNLHFDIHPVGR